MTHKQVSQRLGYWGSPNNPFVYCRPKTPETFGLSLWYIHYLKALYSPKNGTRRKPA